MVFKPSGPWKTVLALIAIELAVMFYFVGPFPIALAIALSGAGAGAVAMLLLYVAIPLVTLWVVFRAHRRGRFIAVQGVGITMRNFRDTITLPWLECSMIAVHDIQPWIKRRSDDQSISLRGLFDSPFERKVFERVVAAARSGGDLVGAMGAQTPAGTSDRPRFALSRRETSPLIAFGVGIIVIALLLLVIGSVIGGKLAFLPNAGVAAFWIGAIIALIGSWRSDRKR